MLASRCTTQLARSCAALIVYGLAAPVWANSIPSISIPGPYGNPVTAVAGTSADQSAALDWYAFLCFPGSTGISSLVPTTDPLASGLMMDFTTNGGFAGSCGNGLFTNFSPGLPVGSTGTFDINAAAGTSGEIGFVNTLGAFSLGSAFFQSTGGWTTVSFRNLDSPTGEVGFEIFSNGGGTLLLDNGLAPVPEPPTLMLFCAALLGLALAKGRRERC